MGLGLGLGAEGLGLAGLAGLLGAGRLGAKGSGIPPFLARCNACFSCSLLVIGRPVSPIPMAIGTDRIAAGKTIPPPAEAGAAAAAGTVAPGGRFPEGARVGALSGCAP